jgi:hypothetical protein
MSERRGQKMRYAASLPERGLRATAAVLGGTLYESAHLLLPRLVRASRLYEVTAKNALRIAIELIGGVEGATREPAEVEAGELAKRKLAGNVVELGSIAAFGFSPLWLLAAASDVLHGSRVYLDALIAELKAASVLAPNADAGSLDELLGALERTSGRAAGLIDIPPAELVGLRRSVAEFREDARSLPSPGELAATFEGLRRQAVAEDASVLEVSAGIGLAFLVSARGLGRVHLSGPYREDWGPLRDEGFAAYARRIVGPYRAAVGGHFDGARRTLTEKALERAVRPSAKRRDPLP